jgi:hypothetical protein
MKTRVQLNLFFSSLTDAEVSMLKQLKSKSLNEFGTEAKMHLCGKDEGKACKEVVNL